MAPKKKEQKTMSLGAFLSEEKYGGSWADEVEESFGSQPLPPSTTERRGGYSSYGGFSNDRNYAPRDSFPTQLPTKPPYTAHLGNLSYDATQEAITEFFEGCDITSVRIIEDRIEQRPKGFAYAEFAHIEGLKQALTLDGTSFQGRTIRVKIADPRKFFHLNTLISTYNNKLLAKERDDRGDTARNLSSWERKGPLADLPSRGSDRRADFGERRAPSFRDAPPDDGKTRDFGNWERKGPLSPLPQPERPESLRDSSRPLSNDASRGDSFRKDRRASPATWGEGRQEGSRPPKEFKERPERPERPERAERAPTAAELDNSWRNNMKPDRSVKSPGQSRDSSQTPASPGVAPSQGPTGSSRPKLLLQKRTVSESPDALSPPLPSAGGSKPSPFGAARPADTAAKEREIAEKREQMLREKREAEEKAKEERRLAKEAAAKEAAAKEAAAKEAAAKETAAKEAAAKEAAEKPAAEAAEVKAEPTEEKVDVPAETKETKEAKEPAGVQNGVAGEQKIPTRPRENPQNPKSRAVDSGNWRTSPGEQRPARGGYQNAPRGARGDARGRGGAPRGPRNFEGRPPRTNGSPASAQQPSQPASPAPFAEAEAAPAQDPDGWTTVPAKGRRNQGARV
ncbi:hypothetical protein DL764_002011 [Monosporascus ibericus]|uniref:RRM domain-containing protein n=1 Tax=Monosporascus ibericus TaxID=155417 RepID=A0A4Q4TQM6_9PEZI|nr:hypothetical protein DL764_002011 [Monosporascus ibericus]